MNAPADSLSILALAGSIRKDSYNHAILRAASELTPRHTEIAVFDGLETIPLFSEDLEEAIRVPPGVLRLRQAIATSDGLVIATPEYNQSIPGVLKNAIDWISRGARHEGLAGLPVAVTGATTGPWGTRIAQTLLKQTLQSTGALVMPEPALFISRVASLIDEEGRLVDRDTRIGLGNLISSLVDWIHLVGSPRMENKAAARSHRAEAPENGRLLW